MLNIKPVSDLRNYNKLLEQVTTDDPVFLTKNGHGKYVVVNIEDYDRLMTSLEIVEKLKKAESNGTVSLDEAKKRFGL
ncbi:type II toxin-antitoxin system prevent-host-death family antitoxin [Enterococcus xiangfangensis]|uniref:Antitoxin n=1 Tax=Enterococcus xiangfangensis TaxID=1296537 RepID=A0ABU3F6W7_9ENTE|nr:type II toxin-antitoxin system prevent-host-death family antitoxin [Enterococcus xiangfangensis]MBM7710617.1 prevent-host-death family protein [Enterococcus xiangfangensis]MDT2758402.1 type II toxin-antitoxin system prevent-host-death family antitoxin [Enterococcus xiangfangensis]NBK09200.1 type II toxin-antitoxin system prevent-host-death family antitoxin [Enterococcus asini]